jgi:hypothetical protein
MVFTLVVDSGDFVLCDNGATYTTSTHTIANITTAFMFSPGNDVERDFRKQVYVIQKPGLPVGFEMGLHEEIFKVTSSFVTTAAGTSPYHSMSDLYTLSNAWDNTEYGRCRLYWNGDGLQPTNTLYKVIVKDVYYRYASGRKDFIDIRCELSSIDRTVA